MNSNKKGDSITRNDLLEFSLEYIKENKFFKNRVIAHRFILEKMNTSKWNKESSRLFKILKYRLKEITRRFKIANFIELYGNSTYKVIRENIDGDIEYLKKKLNDKTRVICKRCGKSFDKVGIKIHIKSCKLRNE